MKFRFLMNKKGGLHLFFKSYEDHFKALKYINRISPNTVEIKGSGVTTNLFVKNLKKWSKNIAHLIDDEGKDIKKDYFELKGLEKAIG